MVARRDAVRYAADPGPVALQGLDLARERRRIDRQAEEQHDHEEDDRGLDPVGRV